MPANTSITSVHLSMVVSLHAFGALGTMDSGRLKLQVDGGQH